MRVCWIFVVGATLMSLACAASAAETPLPMDLPQVLDAMRRDKAAFDTQLLHKDGAAGLDALIDVLLPDTAAADAAVAERVERLIANLNDDAFSVREAAQAELFELGPAALAAVEKASQNASPETSYRARLILLAWQHGAQPAAPYAEAAAKYLGEIKDRERLVIVARRTRKALEAGRPSDVREDVVQACLVACLAACDDTIVDELLPVLEMDDEKTVVWVTHQLGMKRDHQYMPRFLIAALASKHTKVVDTALDWTPNCWDDAKQAPLRAALLRVFAGDDEYLKFQACFPLMHGYHEPAAMDHLIATASSDGPEAQRAIAWLGDSCNWGRPASAKLLSVLVPHLKSPDDAFRRAAADALGTYSGAAIVPHLIERLGDDQKIIVDEAASNLKQRRPADRPLTLKLLTQAAEAGDHQQFRQRCAVLLAELRAEWK